MVTEGCQFVQDWRPTFPCNRIRTVVIPIRNSSLEYGRDQVESGLVDEARTGLPVVAAIDAWLELDIERSSQAGFGSIKPKNESIHYGNGTSLQ